MYQLRQLLLLHCPSVLQHLDQHHIALSAFAWEWMASMGAHICADEDENGGHGDGWTLVFRLWDMFVTEGWPVLMGACVVLLKQHAYGIVQETNTPRLVSMLQTEIRYSSTTSANHVVEELLALNITHPDLAHHMISSGSTHSLRNTFALAGTATVAATATAEANDVLAAQRRTSERDGSKEWRKRLGPQASTSHQHHTMPDVQHMSGIQVQSATASVSVGSPLPGIDKRQRRQLYEQIEHVQMHFNRPVMISRVSSRLIHRLGATRIGDLLQQTKEMMADIKEFQAVEVGTPESDALGLKLVENMTENLLFIGTVKEQKPIYFDSALKNVTGFQTASYAYYRTYPYRPSQWFLDE
jgi:hypothetical protein